MLLFLSEQHLSGSEPPILEKEKKKFYTWKKWDKVKLFDKQFILKCFFFFLNSASLWRYSLELSLKVTQRWPSSAGEDCGRSATLCSSLFSSRKVSFAVIKVLSSRINCFSFFYLALTKSVSKPTCFLRCTVALLALLKAALYTVFLSNQLNYSAIFPTPHLLPAHTPVVKCPLVWNQVFYHWKDIVNTFF